MGIIVKMKMSTNPRLLKDVLTLYKSTFYALKELIDNSIKAKGKEVKISLIPSSCSKVSISYRRIDRIEVVDDGEGVPFSMFERSIMQLATETNTEGLGVGRFGALQIGREMSIETVAYDSSKKKFTRTSVEMTAENLLSSKDLQEVEFPIQTEVLDENCAPYYKVTVSDLYQYSSDKIKKKNKLKITIIKILIIINLILKN